jgi:hypothetical protein
VPPARGRSSDAHSHIPLLRTGRVTGSGEVGSGSGGSNVASGSSISMLLASKRKRKTDTADDKELVTLARLRQSLLESKFSSAPRPISSSFPRPQTLVDAICYCHKEYEQQSPHAKRWGALSGRLLNKAKTQQRGSTWKSWMQGNLPQLWKKDGRQERFYRSLALVCRQFPGFPFSSITLHMINKYGSTRIIRVLRELAAQDLLPAQYRKAPPTINSASDELALLERTFPAL